MNNKMDRQYAGAVAGLLATVIPAWSRWDDDNRRRIADNRDRLTGLFAPGYARERLGVAMNSAVEGEVDRLAEKIGTLATIGAVAPFVGLFGTVWGIMRSFTAIAAENNSSLAVVAPGIAEALIATAIGLFVAIPAYMGYNKFTADVEMLEKKMNRFGDEFLNLINRKLSATSNQDM